MRYFNFLQARDRTNRRQATGSFNKIHFPAEVIGRKVQLAVLEMFLWRGAPASIESI